MFNRVILVADLIAVVVLLVMLNFTTPTDIGPLGILFFFITVYVIMYGVMTLAVKIGRKVLQKQGAMTKKDYLYAAVLAFGPIMILMIWSMGTLSWFTILLVLIFIFLACFLIYKKV